MSDAKAIFDLWNTDKDNDTEVKWMVGYTPVHSMSIEYGILEIYLDDDNPCSDPIVVSRVFADVNRRIIIEERSDSIELQFVLTRWQRDDDLAQKIMRYQLAS